MRQCILLLIVSFFSVNSFASVALGLLKDPEFSDWQVKSFAGETQYSLTVHKTRLARKASSVNTASGLFIKRRIDLKKRPYLHWSWLVETPLPALDEHSQSGDDYAARVYVIVGSPIFFWNTKTLSYVWSSSQEKGKIWDNAYAGARVKMIAARGIGDQVGQWREESRNVYEDLIASFGDKGSDQANLEAYRYISVIAIMTDTDDSAGQSEAYYGEIFFKANQ